MLASVNGSCVNKKIANTHVNGLLVHDEKILRMVFAYIKNVAIN